MEKEAEEDYLTAEIFRLYNHSLDLDIGTEYYQESDKLEAPKNFIFPIVIALSVVFCLLLTLSILSQRALRSPYFYIILSWALVNIFHVTIILSVQWMVDRGETWTLGESGCRAFVYLRPVFMIVKAYHLPLGVVSACLGRQFDAWCKHRPLAAILVPVTACVCIWIMVLLSCIPFAINTRYIHIDSPDILVNRYVCTSDVDHITVFFVLLFVHYLIPIVLTFTLLLVLGCIFVRRSRSTDDPQRDKTKVMIICIIVHVFMLSNLALYVVEYRLSSGKIDEALIKTYRVTGLVSLSDFVLAPGLCLVLPLIRNVFCLPLALYTKRRRNNSQHSSIPPCENLNMGNEEDA